MSYPEPEPFQPHMTPLVSPERARDIARFLKATAEHLAELGAPGDARTAERQSFWWLNYAQVVAQAPWKPPESPPR